MDAGCSSVALERGTRPVDDESLDTHVCGSLRADMRCGGIEQVESGRCRICPIAGDGPRVRWGHETFAAVGTDDNDVCGWSDGGADEGGEGDFCG
jgi:hypothetical protein